MSGLSAGAASFVPGGGGFRLPFSQPAQQPKPASRQQDVADDWDDQADAPPLPGQPASTAPSLPAAAPGAVAEPKTLSIGGASRSTGPSPGSVAQPKSLSIGSRPTAAQATPPPKAQPKQDVAPTRTPAASASASGSATPKTQETITADAILAEQKAAADEETMKDLYGTQNGEQPGKSHVNVVFIGHVDAGKSTMGGNILYLCDMVDKRTMEKYEREAKEAGRESWYLSWALDSTPQERAKGKTVEVGRAYFETPARRYTILDAPGHKTFVPSMISGAAQADVAILVISARKGEFETGFEKGGQTREHVMLVKTAGVQRLIVVINKMDDPTVEWSKERYDEIVNKLGLFIRQSGFSLKTDVTFIPVSAYTGANLKESVGKSVCPWFDGPPLLTFLDEMPLLDRKVNAPMMMPISEKYKDMGTVVVGKVESGHLRKGQPLVLMPNRHAVEVAAIYNEMEDEIPLAYCGDNVRVRLRGVDDDEVMSGFVLTDPAKPVHAVTQLEAQLVILDHKNIICAGYSAVMHVHTATEEVTLTALLHYYDKKTGKKSKKPPQFAKKGQKIIALLEIAAPVCVERFEDHPQLGRFTLRDEGKTIGIGKITKLIETQDDLSDLTKLSIASQAAGNINGA